MYAEVNPPKMIQIQSREQILEMARNSSIDKNANLIVVLRRPEVEEPFRMPTQGYYAGAISQDASEAWLKLR